MARYVHGKTTLAFTAEQQIKLNHAAFVAANARLWTLVELKTGAKPNDNHAIQCFLEDPPFDLKAYPDMPAFVWRQAIRHANRDWRNYTQGKADKPSAFGVNGSFPIRIWEAASGKSTSKTISSDWLGEVSSFGGTPFGPGLHSVNAKRSPTGWTVSFSTKVENPDIDALEIPDTFSILNGV